MSNITFEHPWMLLGLLLVPMMVGWWLWRYRKQEAALQHSNIALFDGVKQSLRTRLRWLPYALRVLAVGAMVVALARPQSLLSRQEMTVEGIDIVMAMDLSGSMLAEDFKPNRLEAAKKVAADFIEGRKTDRMGLVVFAGEAFTQVPLTVDHQVLLKQLGNLKSGTMRDGTALGDGLATAINRIKDSEAKNLVPLFFCYGLHKLVRNRYDIERSVCRYRVTYIVNLGPWPSSAFRLIEETVLKKEFISSAVVLVTCRHVVIHIHIDLEITPL